MDVAIILDIETDEVLGMYYDYLRLLNLQKLMTIYKEMGDEDFSLLELSLQPDKMGGPGNQKGHSQDYRAAGELRNLDQALIETAADIGRLNSSSPTWKGMWTS